MTIVNDPQTQEIHRLIEQLKHGNAMARLAAREALETRGDAALGALITLLHEGESRDRVNAATILGQIGDHRVVEPLLQTLDSDNFLVRQNAVQALGEIGDRRALPALVRALKDESAYVRTWAAKSLANFRDPQTIEPLLLALLEEESGSTRCELIRALGHFNHPILGDVLATLRDDPDRHVREAIQHVLDKLNYQEQANAK